MKTEMDLIRLNSLINLIYEYIDRIAQIVVILYGGMLVLKGEISVGTFYAFYTYLSILIYPVLDLPQLFVSGKQSFVNIDRLEELKDYPVSEEIKLSEEDINELVNLKEIKIKVQRGDCQFRHQCAQGFGVKRCT